MYLKRAQIRLLIGIAETGKLQSAAEMQAMSQPAASRLLSEVEREAGGPLFLRHPKGMIPTEAGEIMIRRGRTILREFDELTAEVGDINAGRAGEVRIGSVSGPAVGCLVPAIRHVKALAPRIEPTIEVGPSAQLFRGLQEKRFDFILARPPSEYDTRSYRILPARSEIVSFLADHAHPLLQKPKVTLADLVELEWVMQERGTPIRQAMDTAFHAQGLPVPVNITNSSSFLVMLAMVAETTAIAPVTIEVGALLTSNAMNLRVFELDQRIAVVPYFIIFDRDRQFSQAAQVLLDEVIARL